MIAIVGYNDLTSLRVRRHDTGQLVNLDSEHHSTVLSWTALWLLRFPWKSDLFLAWILRRSDFEFEKTLPDSLMPRIVNDSPSWFPTIYSQQSRFSLVDVALDIS